ncbi:MAG: TetR/AcrR family transcriptional regulator [Clostridia bacterium]|nr:TetR/AcrR family transcriptional regulator [Clostridia bacterium]
MKRRDVRNRLIERTIQNIAENGLEKTTTKSIVQGTEINEAYIYSNFTDKDDLISHSFDVLDDELVTVLTENMAVMYMRQLDFEIRCRVFFTSVWNYLVGNREKCLAFVRYYYSPYFLKYSVNTHKKRFEPIVETFRKVFIEEADVWMILNHILNVMLDFAVMVHNDRMPEDDDYSEHVFRVIYRSIEQYFKKEEVAVNV